MKAHYFFTNQAFKEMPFGYTTSNQKMLLYSDIAIKGHTVIKHKANAPDYVVSDGDIRKMKEEFDGVIVIADCL